MILFLILALVLILLIAFIVVVVGTGGAIFAIVFGDVIVCIFIIMWLIKKFISKKRH